MLKYTTTEVTFREIPDEICLCINISGCPNHCPGCHSPELWEDVGEVLTQEALYKLIDNNPGITCVCFMGGDQNKFEVRNLIKAVNNKYEDIKTAWYSGSDEFSPIMILELDYYKYGSYKRELGGLDSETTNQKLYKINHKQGELEDITYKFWKNGKTSDSTK